MKKISIVISAYNEERSIPILTQCLIARLGEVEQISYEIIFVNDGSTDRTLEVLKGIQREHTGIRIVNFTRNFGHEIAMIAGMDHAKGDAVLFMDGDGQHPPEVAVQMINKYLEGYNIVLSKRQGYKQGLAKRAFSKAFYTVLNFLSEINFQSNYSDFRLISRKYIERIQRINESKIMFRGILSWIGIANYAIVEFKVPERLHGKSNYNFLKYSQLGLDGFLQFSIKPLRFFTLFALISCIISLSYAFYVFVDHIVNDYPQSGFATIIITMISLFSIQTFIIALIGEYIGRIHLEVKKRPLYFADVIEREEDEGN